MLFLLVTIWMVFLPKMTESYQVQAENMMEVVLDEIVSREDSKCTLISLPNDVDACGGSKNCPLDIDMQLLESLEVPHSRNSQYYF